MIQSDALSRATPAIVVVEDSDEDFYTVEETLRRAGGRHAICRVTSGGECVDLLRGEGAGQTPIRPVLVLLDLSSPGIDGREALAIIKADHALRELPVVVLTTSSSPKDIEFCYRAGANAYHVKPLRHDEYMKLLCTILEYWLGAVTPPQRSGLHI
jgi:CheY-like chemotaxis protein